MRQIRGMRRWTGLALGLLLAGCGASTAAGQGGHGSGHSSAPTASPIALRHWTLIGSVPQSVRVVGRQAGRHLWILVSVSATANHPTGYEGFEASIAHHTVKRVTPVYYPPTMTSDHFAAFGRTASGHWWIAVAHLSPVRGVQLVGTGEWASGQQSWTQEPLMTLRPPSGAAQTPPPGLTLLIGQRHHGWMVSNYEFGGFPSPTFAQTIVYRLRSAGWQVVHAFPVAHRSSFVSWDAAGAGRLLVSPDYAEGPVVVSASGRLSAPWALPHHLATFIAESGSNNLIMKMLSPQSVLIYGPGSQSVYAWTRGGSAVSLVTPGTSLSQASLTYAGNWAGSPVFRADTSSGPGAFWYHGGHWVSVPEFVGKYVGESLGTKSYDSATWSSAGILWALGLSRHVYAKKVAAP